MDKLKVQSAEVKRVASRYGARNLRVFGSVARGEDSPDSDLDLIVSMDRDRTLLDLVAVERELRVLLRCNVDVVVDGGVSPLLEAQITAQAVEL